MALAAAAAFEGVKGGWLVGAIVVDHGLHDGSAEVAATVAGHLSRHEALRQLQPVEVVRVSVGVRGGPEAAARDARYAALTAVAERDDAVVLLGHTLDDQAETVLLGLARGSGLRSIAGMRPASGRYRRPLLAVTRAQTTQACAALAIPVWTDPDNNDGRFARVRVRRTVLPVLESELGPGVTAALARTADLAAADAAALDALAADLGVAAGLSAIPAAGSVVVRLEVEPLAQAPPALRRRVLREAAVAAGCPGGELFAVHIAELERLILAWHGQRPIDLPGYVSGQREGAWLTISRSSQLPAAPLHRE